jgi:hypothetical protein
MNNQLKPVKLHQLLGNECEWSDELWDSALTYLLERLGTNQAIAMADFLSAGSFDYVHKVDYLRVFRAYPPTVLLGAFDYVRSRGELAVEMSALHRH